MATNDASGIHTPPAAAALSLDRVLAGLGSLEGVSRTDIQMGDTVLVHTRNSRYRIQVLGADRYAVGGGWFDRRSDGPQVLGINGCTFGGSAILRDMLAAPGLFLEFDNGVRTTRIQHVGILRAVDSPTLH